MAFFAQMKLKVHQRVLLSFLVVAILVLSYVVESILTMTVLNRDFHALTNAVVPLNRHSVNLINLSIDFQQLMQRINQLQDEQTIRTLKLEAEQRVGELQRIVQTIRRLNVNVDDVSMMLTDMEAKLGQLSTLTQTLLDGKHQTLALNALIPDQLVRYARALDDMKQFMMLASEDSDVDISTEVYVVVDSVTKLGKDMNQISFSPTSELVRSTHSVIQKRWEKVVDVMSALQAADELYSDDWDSVLDAYHILHQALTETGYLLDNIQSLADATDAYQQDSLHAQHQLKDLTDTIQKLNQGAQLLMVEASDDIGSMLADNRFISVGMSVLVFSLLVVVGYGLLRSIKRPLMAFKAFVEQVEEGDLTRVLHLNSGDEFEEASVKLNCLTKRLNLVMSKIGFQANDVISTTDYVMQSSEALSDVLNQQIQAVSEINQIMQTLNTSGARVRDNVEQTHQRIDEVSQLTTQAVQEARDSSCTMNELKQLLTQTRGHVEQLVIDIRDIHGMTNLIGDVAKQTNLLALNAAIEAARASSHGSGFAVVAEKVRELANSANETTNLIRNRIEQIVIQSTDSKESVERCYAIVEKVYERFIVTDGIMNNIDKATNEVSTFTSEVSETAEAQFQHIKSTGVSLDSIAALAHSNVETFKGIRSTMMGLGQVSSSLKKEVEYFKYQDG